MNSPSPLCTRARGSISPPGAIKRTTNERPASAPSTVPVTVPSKSSSPRAMGARSRCTTPPGGSVNASSASKKPGAPFSPASKTKVYSPGGRSIENVPEAGSPSSSMPAGKPSASVRVCTSRGAPFSSRRTAPSRTFIHDRPLVEVAAGEDDAADERALGLELPRGVRVEGVAWRDLASERAPQARKRDNSNKMHSRSYRDRGPRPASERKLTECGTSSGCRVALRRKTSLRASGLTPSSSQSSKLKVVAVEVDPFYVPKAACI